MAEAFTWESIHAYLRSKTHHGNPGLSQAKKIRLVRALSDDAAYWALKLKDSDEAGAREIAAVLMAPLWAAEDDRFEESVLALAQGADWEVREWATEPFIALYRARPHVAHERFVRWGEGASPAIKRAIAVASRTLAKGPAVRLEHLLTWADALAVEEDPYVRKNLGPFAIGEQFFVSISRRGASASRPLGRSPILGGALECGYGLLCPPGGPVLGSGQPLGPGFDRR